MLVEKIKELLGPELSAQVEEKLTGVDVGVMNDGTLVPAEKYESLKATHKQATEQQTALQAKLAELEKGSSTAEELKAQLAKVNADYENYKKEVAETEVKKTKQKAIYDALEKAGAVKSSIDLLANVIKLDEVTLDEKGNLQDVDKLISPIKESRKELFTVSTVDTSGAPNTKEKKVDDDSLYDDPQAFFNNFKKSLKERK